MSEGRSWLARLKRWVRDALRPRFRTVFLEEDGPESPQPRTLYVITEDNEPWHAEMLCPCGCKERLHMSLLPDERPVWQFTVNGSGAATLSPSVNRLKGCRAHFWFRNGQVLWCADQAQTFWKDVRLLFAPGRA